MNLFQRKQASFFTNLCIRQRPNEHLPIHTSNPGNKNSFNEDYTSLSNSPLINSVFLKPNNRFFSKRKIDCTESKPLFNKTIPAT